MEISNHTFIKSNSGKEKEETREFYFLIKLNKKKIGHTYNDKKKLFYIVMMN